MPPVVGSTPKVALLLTVVFLFYGRVELYVVKEIDAPLAGAAETRLGDTFGSKFETLLGSLGPASYAEVLILPT